MDQEQDNVSPSSNDNVKGIIARKRVDGKTLTDEQKAAFSDTDIEFRYLRPSRFSSIGGSEAELTIYAKNDADIDTIRAVATGLNIQLTKLINKRAATGEKTTYGEAFNRGRDAKDLATILARNGIEFEGKDLLKENSRGGLRTI